MVLAGAFLAFILCLLSERVQALVRGWIQRPAALALAAALPVALFCGAAVWYSAFSAPLAGLIAAYTFVPVALVTVRQVPEGPARATDLLAILALWLPLELAVGAALVPRPVQGRLHAIAYGVALTLALLLFLIYRRLPGMKYNLPRDSSDLRNAAVGLLCAAAILIPVGFATGYLEGVHAPAGSLAFWITRVAIIFAATALPEEILFRGLLQNWLVQRLGDSNATIGLAALIFGLSHLNNAPGPLPNWRYAVVAAFAGFIFGKVFQRSTSVLASALVHTGVNTIKHLFF